MPLFTYVVTFKDVHYVVQRRHSNFQGFYNTWLDPFPKAALNRLGGVEKELWSQGMSARFVPVPNLTKVWSTSFPLVDGMVQVVAVQTAN